MSGFLLMLAVAWLRKLWRAGRRSQTFSPREATWLSMHAHDAQTVILKTPYGMTRTTGGAPYISTGMANVTTTAALNNASFTYRTPGL